MDKPGLSGHLRQNKNKFLEITQKVSIMALFFLIPIRRNLLELYFSVSSKVLLNQLCLQHGKGKSFFGIMVFISFLMTMASLGVKNTN
ncbi:hypothetical protein SDC9_163787 [bioreactor metagenome]|uniref:Uncharacterized protein n=1 Tax=bioreactor metagenome TaxID=1076179 RepID=A0A645FPU7_9ZZZZ